MIENIHNFFLLGLKIVIYSVCKYESDSQQTKVRERGLVVSLKSPRGLFIIVSETDSVNTQQHKTKRTRQSKRMAYKDGRVFSCFSWNQLNYYHGTLRLTRACWYFLDLNKICHVNKGLHMTTQRLPLR